MKKETTRQNQFWTKRYGEMDYSRHAHMPEVLARGKYRNYPFIILSVGDYPAAYVCLPEGHPYFGKTLREISIIGHKKDHKLTAHGGLTYAQDRVYKSNIKDRWWVGWDYAHVGDYLAFLPESIRLGNDTLKKWTREEIIVEVKQVVDQLVNINEGK